MSHVLDGIADLIEDAVFNRDVPLDIGAACRRRVLELIREVGAEKIAFDDARALAMDQLRITVNALPPVPYQNPYQERRRAYSR